MVLTCLSQVIRNFKHLFTHPLAIHISFSEKCLFSSLAHFQLLFVLLLLSCRSSLYILDINSLSDTGFANISFHSIGCLYILLVISFVEEKKFLN